MARSPRDGAPSWVCLDACGPPSRAAVRAAALALAVAAALPLLSPAPAVAADVDARGHCSRWSEWRLKADGHDGRIEVEARVVSTVSGRRWHWRILHQGDVSFHGRAVTPGGGTFEVERRMVNVARPDRIGWRATNRAPARPAGAGLTF